MIAKYWPVDDAAALAFAKRVYGGLLENGAESEPLHEAMNAARREIAILGDGDRETWGAYQHYGDPFFRISSPQSRPETREKNGRKARKKK